MLKRVLFAFLFTTTFVFGQVTQNSVTVTATRTANTQPDQVIFGVSVTSGLDASRDDIVAALQGSGITAANFSGVITVPQYATSSQTSETLLQWTFQLPVSLTNLKSTIGLLSAVQASVAKANKNLSVSFAVQGTQVSPQLQQSQTCSLSDLIADARSQAGKLASAANMGLGTIQAISSYSSTSDTSATPISYYSAPLCSVIVKFALGAF